MDKINCGGFYLGEGLELDGNVLNATGSGGGMMVANITNIEESERETLVTLDTLVADIINTFPNVYIINPLGDAPAVFLPHIGGISFGGGMVEFDCITFGNNSITSTALTFAASTEVGYMDTYTYTFPSNNEPL